MSNHKVGNCYKLLGHILRLEEMYATEDVLHRNRCRLSCRVEGECCTLNSGIDMTCHLSDLDNLELVKEADKTSEIDWQKEDIAEIKKGWGRAGIRFTVLGPAVFLGQWWVPVQDPAEEDPDFHKEAGLKKVS